MHKNFLAEASKTNTSMQVWRWDREKYHWGTTHTVTPPPQPYTFLLRRDVSTLSCLNSTWHRKHTHFARGSFREFPQILSLQLFGALIYIATGCAYYGISQNHRLRAAQSWMSFSGEKVLHTLFWDANTSKQHKALLQVWSMLAMWKSWQKTLLGSGDPGTHHQFREES